MYHFYFYHTSKMAAKGQIPLNIMLFPLSIRKNTLHLRSKPSIFAVSKGKTIDASKETKLLTALSRA